MRLCLLLEDRLLKSMPNEVEVNFSAGAITIMDPDGNKITGNHVILEAQKETFIEWLRPFDGIWVGKAGPMQLQQFEVVHIKEGL